MARVSPVISICVDPGRELNLGCSILGLVRTPALNHKYPPIPTPAIS